MPQSREDVAAHRARMEAAMLEDSPAPPVAPSRQSRKRKRTDDSGNPLDSEDEDTNDDDELPRTIVPPSDSGSDGIASTSNGNMVAFAKQFATHKRLKPSQISEVEAFAAVRSGLPLWIIRLIPSRTRWQRVRSRFTPSLSSLKTSWRQLSRAHQTLLCRRRWMWVIIISVGIILTAARKTCASLHTVS